MSLSHISEIWSSINHYIDVNDKSDAAESLVNVLIDQGYEPDEIKDSFRGEKDIAKALKYYAEQFEDDEAEEDIDTDDDEW